MLTNEAQCDTLHILYIYTFYVYIHIIYFICYIYIYIYIYICIHKENTKENHNRVVFLHVIKTHVTLHVKKLIFSA